MRAILACLFRTPRPPIPTARARAIDELERDGTLRRSEAHALRAGECLGEIYAEVYATAADVELADLVEIEARIQTGDLAEAIVQLGRLHPALSGFPALYDRHARRLADAAGAR